MLRFNQCPHTNSISRACGVGDIDTDWIRQLLRGIKQKVEAREFL
ncbi:hypothetical protein [Synechococcus sp. 1G10]|nr:hypothetical protein [Synechococcus sp. 1G10]